MKKTKKIYKNLLIILAVLYVLFTLANQQKTINQYDANSKQLALQIQEQEA